jgi:hypothetical protein
MLLRRWAVLIFGLVFLWMVGVTSYYYIYHKPIQLALALRITTASVQIASAILLITACAGLGRKLLNLATIDNQVAGVLQLHLGAGILGIFYFIIGSLVGIGGVLSWILVGVLVIYLRSEARAWWLGWKKLAAVGYLGGRTGIGILGLICISILISLAVSLTPPVEFDALVYHLAIPKVYIDAGRVTFIPQFFWGMPQLGESLYTWAITLAGDETAVVFGWILVWMTLVGLFCFVRESLGPRPAWIGLAALLAGGSLLKLISAAYVDWLAFGYGFGVMSCLYYWKNHRSGNFQGSIEQWRFSSILTKEPIERRWVVLAGLYSGFAVGVKYSAGILVIIAVIVIAAHRRENLRTSLFGFLAVAIISVAPWIIKNLAATGNPVFPFFWSTQVVDELRLSLYQLPAWGTWLDVLFLPVQATVKGIEGATGFSADIGPLLLILAPMAFLGVSRRASAEKSHNIIKFFSVLGLMTWMAASRFSGFLIQTRLYFCLFPAFVYLAALGFRNLERIRVVQTRISRVAIALVILALSLAQVDALVKLARYPIADYLLGLISEQEYLDRRLGWYSSAMRAIGGLQVGSNVMLLYEPRSYYCLPNCVPDEVLDRWKHMLHLNQNVEQILQQWDNQKITHLLVYELGRDFVQKNDMRYNPEDWETLKNLTDGLELVQSFGEAYRLYRIP